MVRVASHAGTTKTLLEQGPRGGIELALLPAAKLLLHVAAIPGYGFFRDEFYYLACSDRLAAGYVDHPPLSILILKLWRSLFGDSLWSLRLVPALAGAATVLFVGLIARDLGGGRFARSLAMLSAIAAPVYLGANHYYSMNAFDILLWAVAAWLLVRLLKGASPRAWLGLGVVLGLGLENKVSVLWLGLGLFVGVLATARRRDLLTPWPWAAALVAAALFAPHLLWQAGHDWPTLEFIRNATQQKMVVVTPWAFTRGQLRTMNLASAPVWLAGLLWLFASARGRPFRILGWIYVTVFALLVASGSSRAGYLAPAYTWLFAAGAVASEQAIARRSERWLKPTLLVAIVVGGLVFAPFGLPLLPVETYIAYAARLGVKPATSEKKNLAALPQFYADMHGWDSIVATVSAVHRALPVAEQAQSAVFTLNYGVAGAVELLGRPRGLPPAYSGHNNYWLWGPPPESVRTVIIVGGSAEDHREGCAAVHQAAVTDCGHCMPYENANPVFVCRGLKLPLRELWPRLKHYD